MNIDAGGGGGIAAGAAAAVGAGVAAGAANFMKAAADGTFAVSETGGKALLQALREMKDWVDENQGDLQRLSQEPALGGSQAANAMKRFVPQVASDGQGFLTQLMSFRSSIEQAEQGIKLAMQNYQALDQRGAGRQK